MTTYTKEDFDNYLKENYNYIISLNPDPDIVNYVISYTYDRLPLKVSNMTGYLQRSIYRNATSPFSPYQYKVVQKHITKTNCEMLADRHDDNEEIDYSEQDRRMGMVWNAIEKINFSDKDKELFIDMKIEGMPMQDAIVKYNMPRNEINNSIRRMTAEIKAIIHS